MKNLFKVSGFLPYILIIFLNAMTDLGHKIILQNTIFKAYSGSELIILTALVNALILLPFIFLFSLSFVLLIIILTFYLNLPILRKILLANRPVKVILAIPKLISLKFVRNGFTYEYFVFWVKWLIIVLGILTIGIILENILITILSPLINELIAFVISLYIYMLLLTVISVYTSICSIFSKEKLEFPAFIDDDEE